MYDEDDDIPATGETIQRAIDDLSLALDFAKAMLKDGHTNAALIRLHGAMDRSLGDIVTLTDDGLTSEEFCPEMGAISHSGGSVPPDHPPEVTVASMPKAAGVKVSR